MTEVTYVAIAVLIIGIWGAQRVWRRERRRKLAEYAEVENYRGPEVNSSGTDEVYNSDGRPF